MSSRKWPILPALLALVALLAACGSAPQPKPAQPAAPAPQPAAPAPAPQPAKEPPKPVNIKISHYPVLINAPFYVAVDKGFFQEEGINAELVQVNSGTLLTATLLSGDVQFAHPTINQVVASHLQGKKLVYVWNMVNRNTVDLFVSNAVIQKTGVKPSDPLDKRLASLKGLRFASTSPGAPATLYARYLVTKGGMNPDKDVVFSAIGQASAQAAALQQGQVDVIASSPPVPLEMMTKGLGVIFVSSGDVPEFQDFPYHGLAVTDEYLAKNAEVIERVVRAMQKASAYLNKEKAGSVAVLAKYFSATDKAVLEKSWEDHTKVWTTDGSYTKAMVEKTFDTMVKAGVIKEKVSSDEGVIWTNRFIKK